MPFAYILFLEIDWLSVPGLVLEEDNVTLSCHYNVSADKAAPLRCVSEASGAETVKSLKAIKLEI